MDFVQKIYINNKPLILTTDADAYIAKNPIAGGYIRFEGAFPRSFRLSVEHINKPATLGAIIEDFSQRSLQEELHAIYTPIDAGGGVVRNERGEVLMIFRRGKWDLPKGKCDDGETIEECSIREVSEETGLQKLKLGEKICDTYHVYSQKKQNLLKCTAWYNMTGTSKEEPIPQAEENIQEVRWVPVDELGPLANKSYEAIREVMHMAGVNW
ncbi:MAG: NUDIX domain-containing protein [Chitinophagales bacterium]|nr:NUDIX domain-containing protein [Chitinophagaceae bacterium]MCB9065975.1 NUDIX domain-containing protein [Chitinophagales bacterium]